MYAAGAAATKDDPKQPAPTDSAAVDPILAAWPGRPKLAAYEVIDKYGPPHEVTAHQFVWHDNGPWMKTVVTRKEIPHDYRLLVVDDNRDAADSLAMLLKLQGHEVRVAFSSVAALEMTRTCTPDVVFLDIGMPGMNGYAFVKQWRPVPGRVDSEEKTEGTETT